MQINNRPYVFLRSSVKSLNIAKTIQDNLQYFSKVELWSQDLLEPSSSNIEDIAKLLSKYDFAIFVFSTEDMKKLEDDLHYTISENIIFEIGLFIGRIGKERTFYIAPKDIEVKLPTELMGFNSVTYDSSYYNTIAALGAASYGIERKIIKLGRFA